MMPVPVVRSATVLVALTTYRRPGMLDEALAACAAIRPPAGVAVHVLVIDNDVARSAASVVADAAVRPGQLTYVCEPARGLAAVRNRALDEARARGATALAFCDDDAAPETEWLVELWRTIEETGADLVGGPLRARRPAGTLSAWQRLIFRSVAGAALWGDVARRVRTACGARVTITTNNWMIRLALLERAALRFDERFSFSAGEDSDFFRQLVAAGGRTAWAARARMRETIPPTRLSCRYAFRRRFDSTATRTRVAAVKRGRLVAALRFGPGGGINLAAGIALLVVSPLTLLWSLPLALAHLGRTGGFVAGLWGLHPEPYRKTAGY